jgi:hypothetical protein
MLEVTGDLLRGEDWESPIATAHFLQREGEDLEPEVAARISNLKVGETYAQGFDWRVKRIRGRR